MTPQDLVIAREIGRVRGARRGATLIAVGGIHGNETAGLVAGKRVLDRLGRLPSDASVDGGSSLRGELVVFGGNLAAMRAKVRYLSKDMNRLWQDARIEGLEARRTDDDLDSEDREQLELLDAIRKTIAEARGPVFIVDLHTTSAHGVPFVIFGDTLPQRHFVSELPLPIIFGLEEQVDGVLSEYWTRQGCVTFTIEGGQHDDPGSIDNLEAVLLLAAQAAGLFPAGSIAETRTAHALLESRRGNLPHVMEVVKRHAIAAEDQFRMEPGFRNLDHAHEGQLLARDRKGEIRAPKNGLVLLPLYQGLGSDGFFWGRAVGNARLLASEALRNLALDRFFDWLPGVERDRTCPTRLVIDTRIARLYPLEVFHVLGYRRVRERDGEITIERQPG